MFFSRISFKFALIMGLALIGMVVMVPTALFTMRSQMMADRESKTQQMIDVDYVEPTGADLFVNGRAGGQEVVVRVERTAKVAAGDRLPVRWQLDAGLVFDAESGLRL